MSGFLSQAVANLTLAEQQFAGISGLPSAAQSIEASLKASIAPVVMSIGTTQQAGTTFAKNAQARLNSIATALSVSNPDVAAVVAQMTSLREATSQFQSSANELAGQVTSMSSTVDGYFNQINSIEQAQSASITALQSNLGNAQSEEEVARKKYYYLLALGPFGLPGLAVALALYRHWQSEVNNYQSQISVLKAQIASLTASQATCQLMATDLKSVVVGVSDVRNTVNLLVSDVLAISSDLNLGDSLTVLRIAVQTAATEVGTLLTDIS